MFLDLQKQFVDVPYSLNAKEGSQVSLRCLPPQGVPKPKVYWLHEGRSIRAGDSSPYIISSEGSLLISQVKLSHSGNYSCVAENIAGVKESPAGTLTVYGKLFHT